MTIQFDCSHCGRKIRVRDEAAGQKGKCQDCGSVVTVPSAATELLVGERVESSAQASNPAKRRPERPQTAKSREVVDIPPDAQAAAPPVAAAGNREKSNNWARASFATALLALLIAWIPPISVIAIGGVSIALLLTIFAFVLSFRRRGNGRLLSIASAGVSAAAIVLIVVTTSMYRAHQEMVASMLAQNKATLAYLDRKLNTPLPGVTQPATTQEPAAPQPATTAGTQQAASPATTQQPPASAPATAQQPPASSAVIVLVVPSKTASAPEGPPAKKQLGAATNKRLLATLNQGRRLAKSRNIRGAERAFRRIIEGAPGTAIAAEAQTELDALPPH